VGKVLREGRILDKSVMQKVQRETISAEQSLCQRFRIKMSRKFSGCIDFLDIREVTD